jgi:hypothetical protein
MDNTNTIPTSLKVVAFLFILSGIFSLIEVIVSLVHSHFSFNFGVLGLFIGPGLLRLSRGWRTCALVFLWIAMIGLPIFIAVIFVLAGGPLDFKLFGQQVGHASPEFAIVLAALLFALAVWQYRILTRPDVRRLFGVPGA